MKVLTSSLGALALAVSSQAGAATYALSPDGLSVVRLDSSSAAAASTFNSSLLPGGYTSSTAAGGSVAVTTYEAGYSGGAGGAHIEALFTPAAAPPAGSNLRWAQVITTNLTLGGKASPYLDTHLPAGGGVFYDWAGSTTPLTSGQLPFYDFSKRAPASLSSTNPITWNASLYPTVVNTANKIEVHDGVTWGWSMTKAPVGSVTATFVNPAPSGATVSGVGTSNLSWGSGDPSSLSFAGSSFDTTPGTKFKIGTLTFHNGTIASGSGADSVDINAPLHFTNIPELDFVFNTKLTLINTPNVPGDPQAGADQVSLGSFGYTFNVLEGITASVDLMATLSASLVGTPGVVANGADYATDPLDPSPTFSITSISLANATGGGFITQVPEPQSWLMVSIGLFAVGAASRKQLR